MAHNSVLVELGERSLIYFLPNVPVERLLITLTRTPTNSVSPLQPDCYTTLRMSQYNLLDVRKGEPQTAIDLSLDDLYLATEPIQCGQDPLDS